MAELFFDVEKSDRRRDRDFAELEKFNPYHGSDGRFTSAGGASSFTYKPGASKAHDAAIAREKTRTAKEAEKKSKKSSKYQPEGDRAISDRKGGEMMDDIGTNKVKTSSTISALKLAGFKKKDLKHIKRQYDLSDAQVEEIRNNWDKYN